MSNGKFFCEETLSWTLGLFGCVGLFYVLTVSGAREYDPFVIASAFGSMYFTAKIFSKLKRSISGHYPGRKKPSNTRMVGKKHEFLGPIVMTLMFGPVLAWLLLVLVDPSSTAGKLSASGSGLAVFFCCAFLWLNKKT